MNYPDIPYWFDLGEEEIDLSINEMKWNERIAKNVILFIGDGMSIPTITAARIYQAQELYNDTTRAERNYLTFERFPHLGHSKVAFKNIYLKNSQGMQQN